MRIYNPDERIQTYLPLDKFSNLISNEMQEQILDGNYDEFILESPSSRNQKSILKKLHDPVERLLVLTLTAKNMSDNRKIDDRNILFSLSRIPYFLFPNFNEESIGLYSQTDLDEVLDFIDKYSKNLPQYSPRFDTQIIVTLKIEFYVNSFLYFAKSMSEKRFPYGSDFYNFVSFMIHEFFSILKPISEDSEHDYKSIIMLLKHFLNYTTIIYIFEHFPEQAMEISYLLSNLKKLDLTKSEKDLLIEFLEHSIIISKREKMILLERLSKG